MKNSVKKLNKMIMAMLVVVCALSAVALASPSNAKYVISDMKPTVVDVYASETQSNAIPVIKWLVEQLTQDDLDNPLFEEIKVNNQVRSINKYWKGSGRMRNVSAELNNNGANWGVPVTKCMKKYSAILELEMVPNSAFSFKMDVTSYDDSTKTSTMNVYFVNKDISGYANNSTVTDVYACIGVTISNVDTNSFSVVAGEYSIGSMTVLVESSSDAGTFRKLGGGFVKERDIVV